MPTKPYALLRAKLTPGQLARSKKFAEVLQSQIDEVERSAAHSAGISGASHAEILGATVRDERLRLGLTQQQFAHLLGISDSSVRKWESHNGTLRLRKSSLNAFRRARQLTPQQAHTWLQVIPSVKYGSHSFTQKG